MNRTELAKSIYNTAYITGEFLLRSGKISNEYFDKYQFESIPNILNSIADHFSEIIKQDFDYLAALEMGGIPIATALSLKLNIPMVMVRKKAKEYGTQKFAEGPSIKGKKLLIVEDVVTSGGQIIISTNQLREEGAIIETAICVIDRESGGKEALAAESIQLLPLFTMTELKNS
ncbi:MAG TPA: orotate phosphoribosyltransferase [Candidatus Kapabacteria bacterium]|nr:orotate phosphoribosyltransferase [Candidatus Kapabacteria bacterium]